MIELVNLSKTYSNGKKVFQNVTSRFESGLLHLIIGHNGSGKTTLLRIIAGLSTKSEGECLGVKAGASLCFLSTNENTGYPFFTGEEYFTIYLQLYGFSKAVIQDKLTLLKGKNEILDSALKTQYQLCSSGMKQSLRLSAAFSIEADLYLLDEPLRSLDPQQAEYFMKIIRELSLQKIVLMSSHQDLPFEKGHVCLL